MDEIREDAAGKAKIGTTRKGIGPAYEDKVGRRSIRVMDLRSESNQTIDQKTYCCITTQFEKDWVKKSIKKIS